jgi:hypothetical protein
MKQKRGKVLILAIGLGFFLQFTCSVFGAVPRYISYQGKLTNNSGQPLTGDHTFNFRIFCATDPVNAVWIDNNVSVSVVNGLYSVLLGSHTVFGANMGFDSAYWLQVEVDGEVLSPRQLLTASPYAVRASIADSVVGGATSDYAFDLDKNPGGGQSRLLYQSGNKTTSMLPVGTLGQLLRQGDTTPEWITSIGVAQGGTGLTGAGGNANRVLRTTDGSAFTVGTIDNNYLASGSYTNITGVGTLTAGTWNATTIGVGYGGTGLSSVGGNANRVLRTTDGSAFTVGTIDNNYLASGSYTNITGVGTLTAGTWNATAIGVGYGGTGLSSVGGNANRVLLTTNGTSFSVGTIDNNYLALGSYTNITGVGTLNTGTWQANSIGIGYGGTGASSVSGARTNLGIEHAVVLLFNDETDGSYSNAHNTQERILISTGTFNGYKKIIESEVELGNDDASNPHLVTITVTVNDTVIETFNQTVPASGNATITVKAVSSSDGDIEIKIPSGGDANGKAKAKSLRVYAVH